MYARMALITVALLLAHASAPVSAQTPTTGVLEGIVVGTSGEPLADVQVTLLPVTGGATRRAVTARSGTFQVLLLPPGQYDVLVERLGLQPVRYTGVPVRARRSVWVRARLAPAEGAVTAPVQVAFEGASGISLPGASEVIDATLLPIVQDRRFDPAEVLRLSSHGDPDLSMEGLPPAFTAVTVDGLALRTARHAAFEEGGLRALGHSLAGVQQAEIYGGPVGVQALGLGGGLLSLTTRAGGGDETGALTATGSVFGSDLPDDYRELRGAATASASLLGDSAQLRFFGSYAADQAERTRWLSPEDEVALLALADAGIDVAAGGVFDAEDTRLNLGGRFDWLLGENQTLGVTGLYATAEGTGFFGRDGLPSAASYAATDLLLGAHFNARFGQRFGASVQAGFSGSSRELEDSDAGASILVADARLALDDARYAPGETDRSDVQVQATGLMQVEEHLLEVGAGGLFTDHAIVQGVARTGEFLFGSAADVEAALGGFLRHAGPAPIADFTTQELYVFAQDRWTITPGLDLRTGGRFSSTSLPSEDIVPASEWLELTGLDNTALPDRTTGFAVSGGFEWNVQLQNRWLVRGDFTMQSGEIPPALLAEALTVDGRATTARFTGDVGGFPNAPTSESAFRLTLLDDEYEAPITTRASFGFAAAVTPATSLLFGGAFRRTTGLPVRTDLNLLPEPSAPPQYGRSIYGTLVQAGGVVAPEPGTGRRFEDYDVVSAIDADGTSTWWGVSVGAERRTGALDLFASYTFSGATDDLPGGFLPGPGLTTPISDLAPADWHDGTSDYDVPHRLGVGATMHLDALAGVEIGGAFTYASGRPYTPGFAAGIDANADGVFGNDPAFIDATLAGMEELLSDHDCLRENAGRFVERNACRAPARKALDLRLAATVLDGGIDVDVLVEALDLLADAAIGYDRVLYRIDPAGTAELDPTDGAVTLPLLVNPDFGEPLPTVLDPARLRVGLRMRF